LANVARSVFGSDGRRLLSVAVRDGGTDRRKNVDEKREEEREGKREEEREGKREKKETKKSQSMVVVTRHEIVINLICN
jgi:hypothetical protein